MNLTEMKGVKFHIPNTMEESKQMNEYLWEIQYPSRFRVFEIQLVDSQLFLLNNNFVWRSELDRKLLLNKKLIKFVVVWLLNPQQMYHKQKGRKNCPNQTFTSF